MKVGLKTLSGDSSVKYSSQQEKQSRRTNLNDLLQRVKEEKAKIRKSNFLIFSGVLFSALVVVMIISYL